MEHLCIVIGYVDPETGSIRKNHITFLDCESGISSKALADIMLGFVRNHQDPSKMCSQAYDGASDMSRNKMELKLEYHLSTTSPITPIAFLTV